jgi:endonuclease III
MPRSQASFKLIVAKLESHYGTPTPPKITDPLQLIIWENIGYLVEDDRREVAFEALRKRLGLKPNEILSATPAQLIEITKLGGIHPELRATRLKEIAHIVLNDFNGDLDGVLQLPLAKAIKPLKKFPSIGDPGAEKILLFSKAYPVLALDSNGLRVLLRLGVGQESKNYSASYRSVREALAGQIGDDSDFLIKAHQLLRLHGKSLCKSNAPTCESCPLVTSCRYYAALKPGKSGRGL